jgi:acetylornithine deacetylase/succinyl-diaminopimelate desuccinylase-like protein
MSGIAHLKALAAVPRAAGSSGETAAREYAAGVLRHAGFDVREEHFAYSRFPGCFGTPLVGGITTLSIVAAALLQARGRLAVATLGIGLASAGLLAAWMLGDGVLTNPWLRTSGVNLVATRGGEQPRVWLVAHLDSKSQPIPSAVRVAGVIVLAAGVLISLVAAGLTLADVPSRMVWWAGLVTAVAGGLPVMSSVVGNESPGAVDNASGVATVLAVAEHARPDQAFGVLLPSAEELGLAGARAWARSRAPGIAINVDGVDDQGRIVIMHSGRPQTELVRALQGGAASPLDVRRMPPGLMTDSLALAHRGWKTVTVSHGSAATLRRVHSRRDSLVDFTGDAIMAVAEVILLALEAIP